MSFRLSKSKYCNAVQCPKMLWLHRNKPEEVAETRKNLLAYCKLDTYAMVKVWQKLVENS